MKILIKIILILSLFKLGLKKNENFQGVLNKYKRLEIVWFLQKFLTKKNKIIKSDNEGDIEFTFLLHACAKNYYAEKGYFDNLSFEAAKLLYEGQKSVYKLFQRKMRKIKTSHSISKIKNEI